MITIGSKNKVLLFDVSTEGINSENLEFWFRVHSEYVSYSFKGELIEENKVKIVILPLTEMVSAKYLDVSKVYPAKLEVIGDGKYNLVTWEGEIKLEVQPRIDVKLENVQEESRGVIKEESRPKKIISVNIKEPKEEIPKEIVTENKDEPLALKEIPVKKIEEDKPKEVVVEHDQPVIPPPIEVKGDSTELKEINITRMSLLEDILGLRKKSPDSIKRINEIIKD